MKLASLSPAAARQQRQDRLRRERAAAQALRAAFPMVGQLRLDLQFEGAGSGTPVPQAHVMHPPARAFFSFPCPFADCDGQFDLTAPVKAALAKGAEMADGALECSGSRARMRASQQPCGLHLHFTITPEYRADSRT